MSMTLDDVYCKIEKAAEDRIREIAREEITSAVQRIELAVERMMHKDVSPPEAWQSLRHASDWPLHTRVRKMSGSHWVGRVVGYYSTELTPVGYCVESEREKGSVQLYPAAALKRCVSQEAYGPLDVED